MSVIKAVNYGIREEIARKKRKRRRREILFYVMKIFAAVLFVAGLALTIFNFIENIRRRMQTRRERTPIFRKRVAFDEKDTPAEETRAEE
ncbi:MAG: hypothetical protein VB092_06435 [Oscillospiraceae bacterium]|nr:hypothetical protein [Oscillospiraceae bacterium]